MGLSVRQLRTLGGYVLVALLICAESSKAARGDSARMKRILVLGDSLSDGFRLSRSEAYPALLAERLRKGGFDFEVINASASGGTTAGGLARLPPHLQRRIDILIVQLGINDAFRGVPIADVRSNLKAIIDKTKKAYPDCEIVIAGMQLPIFAQDPYVTAFGQMYRELADKNHAALIPYLLEGVGGDPSLNLPDLIHPNAAGHRVLAENVWRVLESVVRKISVSARPAIQPLDH
jgi:acyl-CoA thioesterase-1